MVKMIRGLRLRTLALASRREAPRSTRYDVAAGQVICARGLSGVEIARGAEVSGALETVSRQLAMKLESLKSDLEKPALYA